MDARADFLEAAQLCSLPQRVSSENNLWADWLSRGRWAEVVAAVIACGLRPVWVNMPAAAVPLRSALLTV